MKHLSFLLFILISTCLYSQDINKVDSLIRLIENTDNSDHKIRFYNQISTIYWYNNPAKTIEYGQKALDLAIEAGNDTLIINSQINIGIGYSAKADYDHAMLHFMQSLSLSEKIDYKEGIANASSNIATVYDHLGNYQKSEEFYLKAVKINKERNSYEGTIGTLNNLGILYTKLKENDKALHCYEEAIEIETAIGNKQMLAITLSNIGGIYESNGDNEKAIEYYRSSLRTGQELDSKTLVIGSYINIGLMNIEFGRTDSAIFYFNQAAMLSKTAGFRNILKDIYFYISRAYDLKNDPANSLKYFKEYTSLKDSLLSEESNNKITELQIKYETDVKQQENDLLQKENIYQKKLRNIFLVISVLVIILIVILFQNYKVKKKSNSLLLEKNNIINKQKEQLSESLSKLRESEELYRTLINTSPDGIAITDLNAQIIFISPALLKIYKKEKKDDILGKKALEFISQNDRKKAIRYFQNLINKKASYILEIKGIRSDGEEIDIEINGASLKDLEGNTSSLFFIFRDITLRKQIEEQQRMQQQTIHRQQQEISLLEIQNKEQENNNLKNELDFSNKELTSKAMFIIQNNELIDSVVGKLRLLERKAEEKEHISQIEIRALINDLRTSIRRDSWKEFEMHFTQVHNEFYINLQKIFPELTSNEKKLCAFLRLNLSTKEISDITGKSIHSLNVARTRLRQKLGMTNTDDNLSAFLSRF